METKSKRNPFMLIISAVLVAQAIGWFAVVYFAEKHRPQEIKIEQQSLP